MQTVAFVFYLASLAVASLFSPLFFVLPAPLLVLLACMAVMPFFAMQSAGYCTEKAIFVVFNVALAIALYPPFIGEFSPDVYLDRAEQFQLLRQISSIESGELRLARALHADALFFLKHQSPWLYYLSPSTFLLLFWALMAYLFYPSTTTDNR